MNTHTDRTTRELLQVLRADDVPKVEMFPGFWRQTLVYGHDVMLCLFTLRAGAKLPGHNHVHEQVGYVIAGAVELTVEGVSTITRSGCSYYVPSWKVHSAHALEDSVVLDAFSPPRDEYTTVA
jgi:quercetin dioxygenase-like cupin family protein